MKSLQPTYREMIHDALLENSNAFNEKFMGVMSYKLSTIINDMHEDVASSLLDERYEIDEAVGSGSKTFTFRSSKDAKEFSRGLVESGINKKHFLNRGNTVTLNTVADRDMEEMIISMAKDMKARITEELNILLLMKENLSENLKLPIALDDETLIVLESDDCEAIINLHDSLNTDNQKKLRSNLMESNDNFTRILNFAHKNITKEEG
jgi:hypothetical protein